MADPVLVLASRSPQRKDILERLGVPFVLRPVDVAEDEAGDATAVAAGNARRKALAAGAGPGEVVLGVDTVVALDGRLWGKPQSAEEARTTLRALSGRTHEVCSGVVLVDEHGHAAAATATTRVTFRALDDATVEWYLAGREWDGRAGGYAIQGRGGALVAAIDGDYLNVVGLPVATLLDLRPDLLTLAGAG